MFKKLKYALLFIAMLGAASMAFAEDPVAPKELSEAEQAVADQKASEAFYASLKFETGKITLPNGIASLNLPESFVYLSPADAERVLTEAWGNPPNDLSLGMIFPAGINPVDAAAWGVVITYDEDGHVNDDDASSINYDDLLKQNIEAMEEDNVERKKEGYDALTLVGWAEKPSYDKASHKLYWAKELAVENITEHTLNYNIRVLGRKGVLVLNAISSMNQIGTIKTEMQKVIAFTDFSAGNTYGDFDKGTDKTAEYGIAALIAGGAAAKLGLFGKLFAVILAFKKMLLLGVVALWAGIKKFFSGKEAG
jgi:uncharacterized membrane-anchored protein